MTETLDAETLAERAARRRKGGRFALLAAVGAVVGGGVGYAADNVFPFSSLSFPDLLSGIVALTMIGGGLAGAAATLSRRPSVRSRCARFQVASMLLAGAMLLLPMLGLDPMLSFAGVVVLFVLQTAANVALWRAGDELLRRVVMETGAICFWSLQALLFLYAAAERLGLVASVTAWGLIGVLMVAYVIASSLVALRRGFT